MRDEPLKMNDKVRVTELVAESDIETRLLYEMALVRLRESDLDFGAGMDRKQHEGGPSFGLLRDGAKAFGWVTPIQHEDGFLDIVIDFTKVRVLGDVSCKICTALLTVHLFQLALFVDSGAVVLVWEHLKLCFSIEFCQHHPCLQR